MKVSSEMRQTLLYFWNKKTPKKLLFVSHFLATYRGFIVDAWTTWVSTSLKLFEINKYVYLSKYKSFSYSKNMANFEAFH